MVMELDGQIAGWLCDQIVEQLDGSDIKWLDSWMVMGIRWLDSAMEAMDS